MITLPLESSSPRLSLEGTSSYSISQRAGQIGLDIYADLAFRNILAKYDSVSRVVSEEGDDMTKLREAPYSVALDPIDGSKSALVGIPCGAIFAVFENVNSMADFTGKNVVSSGFFVFGINLELYISAENGVSQYIFPPRIHCHVGTGFGKPLGNGQADTQAGTGNQCVTPIHC